MSDTPLEKLIANICDTSDLTDAEVREELAADGVDVDAAKARTMAKVDALLAALAGRLAIAAVKANPPHPESPMPWRANGKFVEDSNGDYFGVLGCREDAAHIAAAVNAAPVLIAEVERLRGLLATSERLRTEDGMDLTRCQSAMREWQAASTRADDREVKASKEVERLQAVVDAARVAVEQLPTYRSDIPGLKLGADDIDEINITVKLARRALGLEPMPAPPEPQAVVEKTGRECPSCDNDEVFSDGDEQFEGELHRCEQCGKWAAISVTAGRYVLVDAPEPQAVPEVSP